MKKMIILVFGVILTLGVDSSPITVKQDERSGKVMHFTNPEELYSDVLEDMQDPLSSTGVTHQLSTDMPKGSSFPSNPIFYPESVPVQTKPESTPTHEIYPGYDDSDTEASTSNPSLIRPVVQSGMILYGGNLNEDGHPNPVEAIKGNQTGDVKIFWSSVTDAIENLPFIPVQVNVPDVISAMANFLTSSIPIINRFTNPNKPRKPVSVTGDKNEISGNQENNSISETLYGNAIEYRQFKDGVNLTERKFNKKKKKSQRRKSSKRKNGNGSGKNILKRPFIRRTTASPNDNIKVWQLGSSDPGILKNMPITRKRFHLADREVFNFKNSDINNSPIMIVNIPSRPMMYYKSDVKQSAGEGKSEGLKRKIIDSVNATEVRSLQQPDKVTGERSNSKKAGANRNKRKRYFQRRISSHNNSTEQNLVRSVPV